MYKRAARDIAHVCFNVQQQDNGLEGKGKTYSWGHTKGKLSLLRSNSSRQHSKVIYRWGIRRRRKIGKHGNVGVKRKWWWVLAQILTWGISHWEVDTLLSLRLHTIYIYLLSIHLIQLLQGWCTMSRKEIRRKE